jgi:ABC-type uncharacterized transport system permease subunit
LNDEEAQKKLTSAREIYRRQNELTALSLEGKRKPPITWREWWEGRWGENYADYVRRMARERERNDA